MDLNKLHFVHKYPEDNKKWHEEWFFKHGDFWTGSQNVIIGHSAGFTNSGNSSTIFIPAQTTGSTGTVKK